MFCLNMESFLVLLLLIVHSVLSLDVKIKGDSCSSYDSCSVSDFFRTCSCSDDCYLYSTCCADAKARSIVPPEEPEYECYAKDVESNVFAKIKCAKDFQGSPEIMARCIRGNDDYNDVVGNLLVTSTQTKTTYRNYYCAICNNEERQFFLRWNIEVLCPMYEEGKTIDEDYVREHLYLNEMSEWGVKVEDTFVPCSLIFLEPTKVIGKLKYCAPNVISFCPYSYHDHDVIDKCNSYYGERRQRGTKKYFKNVHCALCNGVDMDDLECLGRNYRPIRIGDISNTTKVIFNPENWVGKSKETMYECPQSMDYDPFNDKCRKVPFKFSISSVIDALENDSVKLQFTFLIFVPCLLVLLNKLI